MFGIYLLAVTLFAQVEARALPELKPFLDEFRKNLHTDDVLLSQYTYSEKRTHVELSSNEEPKKTETYIYQVTRGSDGTVYRRLVSKDGAEVRSSKPEKVNRIQRNDEQSVIDDVFAGYDMKVVAREEIDGRPAIRIRFTPRLGYHPKTRQGKILQHVAGDAWINEADHQLARVDAEVTDTISIGFGLVAKLQKGAKVHAERRKVNNEVWLPAETQISLNARVLMLKGFHLQENLEYFDYKKYNVETIIKIQ
jgi:hypothetical protein